MRFVIGKKYRFSRSSDSKLIDQVRGKIFIPIEVTESHTRLQIFTEAGDLIPGPNEYGYWTGDPETSDRWDIQIDFTYSNDPWGKSRLEFKFV
jgi:hypothetical protein